MLAAIRGIRGFPDAFGLAGEGGFIDAEVVGAQDKAVRRDFYALFYEQKIPGDEILAGDLLFPAIPDDFGMRGGELFRAARVLSVLYSWNASMLMMPRTKTSMMAPSRGSPKIKYTTEAASSSKNMGSQTVWSIFFNRLCFFFSAN